MPRQSYLSLDSTPEPNRRSKKLINRQSLSPVKQRRLSSAVSTPTLNDDLSEKLMRTTNRRNALNEINKNLMASVATPRKTSDGPNRDADDNSAYNTPRVPNLSNFEEWMKLATDNKINATNSWNFALIDYFHDMSLLKEGDGINFQKASCTLDGCVKIYTSRIDSVVTETGKLLSGLTENSSKLRKKDDENDVTDSADDEDDNSEEHEEGTKKAKRRVRSEATLVTDFSAIQLKKLDLEFSVDPLFKKASADFDEGGAKGLLFNHLSIDNSGRVVFDTSEESQANPLENAESNLHGHCKELDLGSLRDRYFSDILDDLDSKFISPSLKDFEFPADPNAVPLDIPFLRSYNDDVPEIGSNNLRDDYGGNDDSIHYPVDQPIDGEGMSMIKEEFGNGGDLWLSNIRSGSELPEFDKGFVNGVDGDVDEEFGNTDNPGSYILHFVKNQAEEDENGILAYFDDNIKKNWTGLQHWRIQKARKDAQGTKKLQQPRQPRKKEELTIDFFDDADVDEDAIFEQGNPSSTLLPKTQWRSETRNLLQEETNFNPKDLFRLFLKPRVQLHFRKPGERSTKGGTNTLPSRTSDTGLQANNDVGNPDHYDDCPQSLDADEGRPQIYDANFFNDDAFGPGLANDDRSFVDAAESLDDYSTDISLADGDSSENHTMVPADATINNDGNLTTFIRREEAQEEFEFGSQLVLNSGRKFKTDYVNYARVAKKVDVKKLKDNLWKSLDYDRPSPQEKTADEALDATGHTSLSPEVLVEQEPKYLSDIVSSLKDMYPAKAMADISTSFCFICLLHLANEKGLDIKNNENFTDLTIRRDLAAVIDEY
ncbi:condensin complex subunit 2/barren [Lipomyces kononenkoae]